MDAQEIKQDNVGFTTWPLGRIIMNVFFSAFAVFVSIFFFNAYNKTQECDKNPFKKPHIYGRKAVYSFWLFFAVFTFFSIGYQAYMTNGGVTYIMAGFGTLFVIVMIGWKLGYTNILESKYKDVMTASPSLFKDSQTKL